jgi:hypothetical protein
LIDFIHRVAHRLAQQVVTEMKLLVGLLGTVALFAGASSAWGDARCQRCTHEMQMQYRKCLKSGKDEAVCKKAELETAQLCVAVCNPK